MKDRLTRFLFPFSRRTPSPRDRYAGYHARVLSSTIDLSCLFFLLFEPFAWLGRLLYGNSAPALALEQGANMSWQQVIEIYVRSDIGMLMFANFGLQLLGIAILLISCQYGFGTTPGRYLLGLRLVDAKTEEEPSLFQLIRRFLGYFIAFPPLMLGYIWCSWDAKRQTWHDKIAGTVVLDERPNGWYWQQVKRLYRKLRGLPEASPPSNDNQA